LKETKTFIQPGRIQFIKSGSKEFIMLQKVSIDVLVNHQIMKNVSVSQLLSKLLRRINLNQLKK